MKLKFLTISILALTAFSAPSEAEEYRSVKELREAVRLFDTGMRGRAGNIMDRVAQEYGSADARGYSVLCDVMAGTPGYQTRMENFFNECPYSKLISQIKYRHAQNLFYAGNYEDALKYFDQIKLKNLYKSDRIEYLFNRAYSCLELQQYDLAYERFSEVTKLSFSDYTYPSAYALGYIRYNGRD